MAGIKICRICLRSEAKIYKFNEYQLKSYYEEVLAYKVDDNDGLPHYFCFECAMMLHKFHKFKEKCYTGQKVLKEMLWQGSITYESVYKVDRKSLNLASPLEILNANKIVKIYSIKDTKSLIKDENIEGIKENDISNNKDNLLVKTDNIEDEVQHGDELNMVEFSENDDSASDYEPVTSDKDSSPVTVFIGADNNVDFKAETLKVRKTRRGKPDGKYDRRISKLLGEGKWKKISLSEEEALLAFRARSEEDKYITAASKCTDCYKSFSKEEMLVRHRKLRHDESLGPFECRFCKMRFKWDCFLRKHMKGHYSKYECQRCNLVCPLETTALLHEDYHSGMTKKCVHCNEEFRHFSTYYTHLRTHRSNHLCTLCGISFVSEIGLQQHKHKIHCTDDVDSPDDDEDVNTFCARCDIRFETRKAYEEHMFHSTSHANEEYEDENTTLRKNLGKKTKNEITNKFKNRKREFKPFVLARRNKKPSKKPTTCHQCGKHFDTQAACLRHHFSEHPRTSFYPSTERHICEICGASLAPGSIANHQNTHTRETLHPCDTCGKQFNSVGGLKRHMVTHTGEKPYACSLCDKRFTQSNSMKLHYRTFHLKEPWPKRNRKKKKGNPQESVEPESSEEDSEDNTAESKKVDEIIKPADVMPNNSDMHVLENTEMQYLPIGY